jgi:hypothetical protein
VVHGGQSGETRCISQDVYQQTLTHRELDFADAEIVFSSLHHDPHDDREDLEWLPERMNGGGCADSPWRCTPYYFNEKGQ